jgi:hypothetical protein
MPDQWKKSITVPVTRRVIKLAAIQRAIHNFRDWCCHLVKKLMGLMGLMATITLKAVPFCMYAPFPELLPFLKCILEVVACENVQQCLSFSFIFDWGKT